MFSSIAFTAYLWLSLLLVSVNAASLGDRAQDLALHRREGPFTGVVSSSFLACWPFVGTFSSISFSNLGPALVNGPNVALSSGGYVQIRQPGYLSIPKVDIRTTSFAISFNLRLPTAPTSRQVLLSNWQANEWQYFMAVDATGTLSFDLRRNIQTDGSDPEQGLVGVTTAAAVPVGTFFNVVYIFDTTQRTLSVYINGALSASAVVRSEITDLTLHDSTQSYVQFGSKGDDDPVTGTLDADLNQLCFIKLGF